jgi:hypothetical protein
VRYRDACPAPSNAQAACREIRQRCLFCDRRLCSRQSKVERVIVAALAPGLLHCSIDIPELEPHMRFRIPIVLGLTMAALGAASAAKA